MFKNNKYIYQEILTKTVNYRSICLNNVERKNKTSLSEGEKIIGFD